MGPRTKERHATARHEAAHAVVAVRLGLPLVGTDIRRGRPIEHGVKAPPGMRHVALGWTEIEDGFVEARRRALPDERARQDLAAMAVHAMAGVAADVVSGGMELFGDASHQDDLYATAQFAGVLGIGESLEELAVQQFTDDCYRRALDLLGGDNGAAWDRVRVALERRQFLTGAEVVALVG